LPDVSLKTIIIAGGVCYLLLVAIIVLRSMTKGQRLRRKVKALASDAAEITPEKFFKLRSMSAGKSRKFLSSKYNFSGVYILFNKTKNMYYVGQGQNVFERVNRHFTGKGNGDVYADFKYGDKFTIRMIELKYSGFNDLNELERRTIEIYDAYSSGYNKTHGNIT